MTAGATPGRRRRSTAIARPRPSRPRRQPVAPRRQCRPGRTPGSPIIDLETGGQPLYAADGAALVANGEIYNYIELREELPDAQLRDRLGLRAAAAPLPARGRATSSSGCAACTPSPARSARGRAWSVARSVRHQAALLRRDAGGLAFASEPQALLAGGLVAARCRRERARRAAAAAVHHRRRDDLRRHPARAAGRDAWSRRDGRIVERRRRAALPAGGRSPTRRGRARWRALDAVLDGQRRGAPALGRALRHVPVRRHRFLGACWR